MNMSPPPPKYQSSTVPEALGGHSKGRRFDSRRGQWCSQGHSFGGGGQSASAEGASYPRVFRGHAHQGNFEI